MSCASTSSVATIRPVAKRSESSESACSLRAPLPYVPEMLATLRPSPKYCRRLSGVDLVHHRYKCSEPEDLEAPPVFITPNYEEATTRPPADEISPLTVPDPAPRRAASVPLNMSYSFKNRRVSVASDSSISSEASSKLHRRRRRSSATSVESFSSNEDRVTLKLKVQAFPSTMLGIFTSVACIAATYLGVSVAATAPVQSPPPRPSSRRSSTRRSQSTVTERRRSSIETITTVSAAARVAEQEEYQRHLPRPSRLKRCLRKFKRPFAHITVSPTTSSRAIDVPVQPTNEAEGLVVPRRPTWKARISKLFSRRNRKQ